MSICGAIVVDIGKGSVKAGMATGDWIGDTRPSVCFPTCVGLPKYKKVTGNTSHDVYVGDDAVCRKGVLSIEQPGNEENVERWKYISHIWDYTFYKQLRVDPPDHSVLLTETANNEKVDRETVMEMLFEEYSVSSFYISTDSVLSLYANGRTNGIVMSSGVGATRISPVYNGHTVQCGVKTVNIAGNLLTDYLNGLLNEEGLFMNSASERHTVNDIKEKRCYVSLDYEAELKEFEKQQSSLEEYEMPDGKIIKLGDQLIKCAEVLFKSELVGSKAKGVHESISDFMREFDVEIIRRLSSSIYSPIGRDDPISRIC